MTDHHEDDLAASKTEGFKVGEKKTIEEYTQLGMFTISARFLAFIPLPSLPGTFGDTCRHTILTYLHKHTRSQQHTNITLNRPKRRIPQPLESLPGPKQRRTYWRP